jgi:hypothetical protein
MTDLFLDVAPELRLPRVAAGAINKAKPIAESQEDARQAAIRLAPAKRAAFVEGIVVNHHRFCHIEGLITHYMRDDIDFDDPGGLRIIAESGMGKTLLQKIILSSRPAYETGDQLVCPVLCIMTSRESTRTTFTDAMLRMLGYVSQARNESERRKLLVEAIQESRVRVLLNDEAQRLGGGATMRAKGILGTRSEDLAIYFKELYDETGIPQVHFGDEDLDAIFTYDHLSTRMPGRCELAPLTLDAYFEGVLRRFDELLPMSDLAGLADGDMPDAFMAATGGRMRPLKKLLRLGVFFAAEDCKPRIELKHWIKAYFSMYGTNPSLPNPFEPMDRGRKK